MYTMKSFTATKARQNFFKLLDWAVRGEKVIIEREGVPLELHRVSKRKGTKQRSSSAKSYQKLIRTAVDQADQWGWNWDPDQGLRIK